MPSTNHMPRMRSVGAVAILALLMGAAGCKTTPTRTDASAAYQSGRYAEALAAAKEQAEAAVGAERQKYRFIAGMSAFQLKRDDEALRYLTAVTTEDNNAIAGPASATTGLIYARTGSNAKAIPYFEQATKKLTGEDQAQAYYHLGSAQQRMGQWTAARTAFEKAAQITASPSLRESLRQRAAANVFTVQVGSFGQRTNAEKLAASLQAQAAKLGYGAARVVPTSVNGTLMYLVHVGTFPTHDAATRARSMLGKSDAVIVDVKYP